MSKKCKMYHGGKTGDPLAHMLDGVYGGVMEEKKLLTSPEVARRFRVNTITVRRWAANGTLTPAIVTPGGRLRFDEAAVEALVARLTPERKMK